MADFLQPLKDARGNAADGQSDEAVAVTDYNHIVGVLNGTAGAGGKVGANFFASNPPNTYVYPGAPAGSFNGIVFAPPPSGDATGALDYANLQALFNDIATGVGVPAIMVQLGIGAYLINAQLIMFRKAIILRGCGVGNPKDYGPNNGLGSTIRWVGSVGGLAMIQIQDARSINVEDIYFQGNTAHPPLAGIEFFQGASDTIGVNRNITIARCLFGYLPWVPAGGTDMTYCIAIDGTNANNQMHYFEDCQFNRPLTAGVYMPNPQSIWCGFSNCTWDGNNVAKGLVTSANTTLWNASFGQCLKDIEINSTANVVVHGFNSENSAMIFDIVGDGALHVFGGVFTITSVMQGFAQIAQALHLTDNLTLEGVKVNYQITPKPPIVITGNYAPVPYTVRIAGCKGLPFSQLTFSGYGAPGVTYLDFQNDGQSIRRTVAGAWAAADATWTAPVVYQAATLAGRTAAVASLATATALNDGNKHLYRVWGVLNITTHGTESINVQVSYTDDGGTARTATLTLTPIAGTDAAAANAAGPWTFSAPISCNPNTAITVLTAGTFTGATYNISAAIEGIGTN